ncbi:MAG: hypothetical protein KTR25_15125 [Myxococcales bacterium]|nr:hypothetical protein [Myxococcales bacterium]
MGHDSRGNEDEEAWSAVDSGSEPLGDTGRGRNRSDEGLDNLFTRRESKSRSRGVPDFVRRAIENTMGSVQSTQNVSKEAFQFFLSTTDKTRREIVRIAASEVGAFLRQSDIASEVVKILTSVEADVKLSIKFKRTEQGVSPEVRTRKRSEEVSTSEKAPEDT